VVQVTEYKPADYYPDESDFVSDIKTPEETHAKTPEPAMSNNVAESEPPYFRRGQSARVAGGAARPKSATSAYLAAWEAEEEEENGRPFNSSMQTINGDGRNGTESEDVEDEPIVRGSAKSSAGRRKGRRLSLEADKAPDLSLLAAVRRTSMESVGSVEDFSRLAEEERRSLVGGKRVGEVAALSPSAHNAILFDFASPPTGIHMGPGFYPPSVDDADDYVTPRKRRNRRLSLEVEKVDESVLAAVRRTIPRRSRLRLPKRQWERQPGPR